MKVPLTRTLFAAMVVFLSAGVPTVFASDDDMMAVQRLVWQCQARASDMGLSGRANDRFVQRCVDSGGNMNQSRKKKTRKRTVGS